jgi:PAS domain S-box-containing protein
MIQSGNHREGVPKTVSANQAEGATREGAACTEFADEDVPTLLAQCGRPAARLARNGDYVALTHDFTRLLASMLQPQRPLTLQELWDKDCYEMRIQTAFARCQSEGPQMVRACRLKGDPARRSLDLLFLMEAGKDEVLQILFEDHTERLHSEAQDELQRLRSIIDLAPVLISIKDRHSIIRLTNRMFDVLDGPKAEDYVNRSVFDVFPRDVAERLWKNDLAVFHTGAMIEDEEKVRHRDGIEHTYLTYKFPLITSNGVITEVCAISIDITVRKYYEQQAFEAMRKAEEANRVKSDFLAHMSHEIRTPLTIIRGYADLIARKHEADPARIRTWINSVVRASQQLELIINDILDLSKVEAGVVELHKHPTDLQQLLQDLHHSFALRAQEKNINFHVIIRDQVPTMIVTDALRLRQVLDNLVSNALKFTEKGSVELVVELAPSSEPRLQLWVRDTGIGLSADEQKKLFQPFVQADGSITRKYGGTGLGLTLAKRLAELLGGDVGIHRSEPHVGTEMLVTIPLEEYQPQAASTDSDASAGSDADVRSILQGRRLLLVEDAEDIRELLRYILVQQGALVDTVVDGVEALDRINAEPFDLVLMDLQMPVLDGMHTMMTMRARDFRGCIVAVTAHALQGERERCLKAGFDGFLSKPLQLPELFNLIGQIMPVNRAETNPIKSHHES